MSLLKKLGRLGAGGDFAADGAEEVVEAAVSPAADNIVSTPAPDRATLLELIEDKAKLRNWIALRLMEESTLCPTTSGRLKALSQLSELCLVDERTKYKVENNSGNEFNIVVVSERLEQARQLKIASVSKLSSIKPAELASTD